MIRIPMRLKKLANNMFDMKGRESSTVYWSEENLQIILQYFRNLKTKMEINYLQR